MATIKISGSVIGQLDAGASILAAARTADTRLIKPRMTTFEGTQRDYTNAQEKVQAAEARLGAAQLRLGELDVEQDAAVDALARALIVDGKPRGNPFSGLGGLAPGALMALPVAEEPKAIDRLVAAVKRAKGVTKATLATAQAAGKAARAVEQGLAEIGKCQVGVRGARQTRDAIAQKWATALAALKRGARAAADDGAASLYATLFDRPSRPSGRSAKPTPAPTAPPPAPAPSATS